MKNKTKSKENLEVLIDSFKTEVGNFLLKKLMFNWYSVSELTKLWIAYKNNIIVNEVDRSLRTKKEKTNPRIAKLVKFWYQNNLLTKGKVKKEFKRIRNKKVHTYSSVAERFKLNETKLFVVCIKYLLKKHYEFKRSYFDYWKRFNLYDKFKVKLFETSEEHELKYYEESLKEVESMEEELKPLLEETKNVLFFDWSIQTSKMNLVGYNILQLVESFLENWKNILELKGILPESFIEMLEEKDLNKVVEEVVKTSSFVKLVLLSKYGKECVEEITKPEIKLIVWFLTHPKKFLNYLFETKEYFWERKSFYQKALYYLNILTPTFKTKQN